MVELRKAAEMALEALREIEHETFHPAKVFKHTSAIISLRQALAQPDNTSDSAESFCKQELHNLMSVAGRMALELECLLLDTKDLSVVSKWWDTGMEALQSYRDYIFSITHGKDGEHFCDTHCVHTDHHPDCELAQPEQKPNNWWDDKEYVKSRFGDSAKIVGVRYGLPTGSFKQPQPEQEPVAWKHDCAALLLNDVELWVDRCPHCGKPRPTLPKHEQEPVAWMYVNDDDECEQIEYGIAPDDPHITLLYTAPPKREWVGLTDEERVQAFVDAGLELAYMDYDADKRISEVIEAKLREKNT